MTCKVALGTEAGRYRGHGRVRLIWQNPDREECGSLSSNKLNAHVSEYLPSFKRVVEVRIYRTGFWGNIPSDEHSDVIERTH